MAINSYFYDSTVEDPRTYSAADFARAFDIAFETGCMIRETYNGTFGFDIGGTNNTTIYAGSAMIEGHFVEVTGTEILTVPTGSYAGQVVIHLDVETTRAASLIVKQDRSPIQTASVYELVLYDVAVENGVITTVTDKRYQGGAIPNNHNHKISEVTGLQDHIDKAITWVADPNGVKATIGKYAGTGKPIELFLTTAQPAAVSSAHRVWIQIDNF